MADASRERMRADRRLLAGSLDVPELTRGSVSRWMMVTGEEA
jgi:hypothetical protein